MSEFDAGLEADVRRLLLEMNQEIQAMKAGTVKERRTSTTITMPSWAVLLFITLFLAAWSYIFLGTSTQVQANAQANVRQDTQIAVVQEQITSLNRGIAELNTKIDTLLREMRK